MQRVGLQSHTGVVQAGGHTCCSGLTEVPCLMSTSSIGTLHQIGISLSTPSNFSSYPEQVHKLLTGQNNFAL